jgi:hypothetical protein
LQTELLESRLGWNLLEPWFDIQPEPGLSSNKRRERIISEIRLAISKNTIGFAQLHARAQTRISSTGLQEG